MKLRLDSGTAVSYRGQAGRVSDLDPGDLVRVELRPPSQGGPGAASVMVDQSVQDRQAAGTYNGAPGGTAYPDEHGYGYPSGDYGSNPSARSYDGTVEWVDMRAGTFGLRTSSGQEIRVSVPFNAGQDLRSQFSSLAQGQRVSLLGTAVSSDRVELVQFR